MSNQSKEKEKLILEAKRYSNIKYCLSIIETVYLLALLVLFQRLGLSEFIAENISGLLIHKFFVVPVYIAVVLLIYYVLNLSLNYYGSFVLEHKFLLSNQKISDWIKDQAKSGIIFYIILLILFAAFYNILELSPNNWWLIISLFWIFFSLVLARLTPTIIIPLFYKYKKLSDESLRQRIINLAGKVKVKILDVFEIDFSKKTMKANAAFVGLGRTRRVVLADTLKDKYNHDEIEVILAHEFAHYKLKHLFKLILINSLTAVLAFYLIFKTSNYALGYFNVSSLSDIAAFPVIIMYLVVFGIIMQPLENYISRRLERSADKMALQVTGLKSSFVSMMEKLSLQNFADRRPHPIMKFFFFDHPPVDERINMAKSF